MRIDPRTGRPLGDHGTANDAIDYALDGGGEAWTQTVEFLTAWRDGDLSEWPEYYRWLRDQGR